MITIQSKHMGWQTKCDEVKLVFVEGNCYKEKAAQFVWTVAIQGSLH